MANNRILSVKEVAEILECSTTTVRNLITQEAFIAVALGKGTKRMHWGIIESSFLEYKKDLDKRRGEKYHRNENKEPRDDITVDDLLAEMEKQTKLLQSIERNTFPAQKSLFGGG